jgi:tRNA A-37 threonylcarbamoyl transferase component Bud32/dienelactone hydrolase
MKETLSHYEILETLGEGGMGVVHLARDTRLERNVAIKLLRPEALSSAERRQRFVREAKAASALSNSHIVTIHEIDQDRSGGIERDFLVMEHLDGGSLAGLLASRRLEVEEALTIAVGVADGLAAAHEAGIVHRDIKPANILLTRKGEVKIADFGLAKLTEPGSVEEEAPTRSAGLHTAEGTVLGTAAYMSPEQAEGRPVDARSDVFSFGSVLYEMLTGRRPFDGDSSITTRMAILGKAPAPPRSLRAELPPELERLVLRCLEKPKEARYASGAELLRDLQALRGRLERERTRRSAEWRRPRVVIPVVAFLIVALVVGAFAWRRKARERWARSVALPEIARLTERDQRVAAFRLAREARAVLPGDPELDRLWDSLTMPLSITKAPAGGEVRFKDYAAPDSAWESLGRTPLDSVRLPVSYLRWRFDREGLEPVEGAGSPRFLPDWLASTRASPAGMVWVPPGTRSIAGDPVEVEGFWLDRFEVTNREYKRFVGAGGYRKSEYWKEPFVRDGREVSWEAGIGELVDQTGRPGPAAWELGDYPAGEDDYPVRGVSWYEAVAFAEFAGKSLPTIHHWFQATDRFGPPAVLELSNFGGQGPAPVGRHQGLGPYGTFDMAGNVKEWCWNRSGDKRYTLGGAWDEAVYMYQQPHAQAPFDRSERYGFRCAKYDRPPLDRLTAPVERIWRDYAKETPVGDDEFRLIASAYAYDKTELKAETRPEAASSPHWRSETIAFDAAYGGERVTGHLYLPANARPPFQTVVYYPGSGAEVLPTHQGELVGRADFVIRSGRAVLFPNYKGLWERRLGAGAPAGPQARRDLVLQSHKDLARALDYLETREDIDSGKLAFYGFSLGANRGLIFTSLDKRFRTSILLAGGFWETKSLPEVDLPNFAPRVRLPTLMLSGRDDFRFPLDVAQQPMFRALGTPDKDKRHALVEGGHVPPRSAIIKEILDWLDRYLGPVETTG